MEIIGPSGRVHYRRSENDPMVEEAKVTAGYSVRRQIWDGKGDAAGQVVFTKDSGEIVGRSYVRRRVVAALARVCRYWTKVERAAAVASTIDDDEWLVYRASNTVSAICRAVVERGV